MMWPTGEFCINPTELKATSYLSRTTLQTNFYRAVISLLREWGTASCWREKRDRQVEQGEQAIPDMLDLALRTIATREATKNKSDKK
jgi:hypothetical protein